MRMSGITLRLSPCVMIAGAWLVLGTATPRAADWAEKGPWQVRHQTPELDDLGQFLGIDHWSGGFVLPSDFDSVRIAVQFYRDGERLDRPRFQTSWVSVGKGPRDGQWAVQLAPGSALARVTDEHMNVIKIHLRCQNGASAGGTFPAADFGGRGNSSWIGGLHENDSRRPLLLYKWNAVSGYDLNGEAPRTLDQLLERTAHGDLMLVWLEGR